MEPTALFDDGAIVAFIDLVGTFGVGGGAAFHDFVEPYEVGLLHGGFQLVAGLEVDVHRLHVAGREGFFCVGSLGAEGDVKGSPVAQLHAFAVEQETLHHLAQLADSHLREATIRRLLFMENPTASPEMSSTVRIKTGETAAAISRESVIR